jgi:hypothetical protein
MSVNANAVVSDVRQSIVNRKANAGPMAVRLAWHASGTFDKSDNSGGSDGATMRFAPESTDGANAGLSIIRDMVKPVKKAHPDCSIADIWALTGGAAIEFCGGPKINVQLGRTDATGPAACPPNGRLPDASQGAQHLRDVFYRMGFNDQEIVALSGAHTLGRCHLSRSGFDGPWTRHPLKFDNTYFKNLLNCTWTLRKWDGNEQFEDETGELMMLPTDIALIKDEKFKPFVDAYAADEKKFFDDFAAVFEKLVHLGCKTTPPKPPAAPGTEGSDSTDEFLEHSMHGSFGAMQRLVKAGGVNVHAVEKTSGRSALHKAAFWGHSHIIDFLVNDCKLNANTQDYNGDTALHDACRFGHEGVVSMLLSSSNASIKNKDGHNAFDVAKEYSQDAIVSLLSAKGASGSSIRGMAANTPPDLMDKVIANLLDQIEEVQRENAGL